MPNLPPLPPEVRMVRMTGCFVLALLLSTMCLLPFVFFDLAKTALENLHLSPPAALLVLVGILVGSIVNLPISRFPSDHEVSVPVFEPLGGIPVLPRYKTLRQETVVSVNVGGCVIPILLSVWLSRFIVDGGTIPISATVLGVVMNAFVCFRLAKLVPGMGIALPPLAAPLTALVAVWLGFPLLQTIFGQPQADLREFYAPVAFVVGISGPLLGADLLHYQDFKKIGTGSLSIGGMGTWDGIVLSGLMAALLA